MENRLNAEQSGEAVWRFAVALYDRPGVAPAALALQERGFDVIVLLACLFADGRPEGGLSPAGLDGLVASVEPWQQRVTRPLRVVRDALKSLPDAGAQVLRSQVKAVELEAERVACERAAVALAAHPPGTQSCDAIFALYAARLGLAVGPAERELWAELISARAALR